MATNSNSKKTRKSSNKSLTGDGSVVHDATRHISKDATLEVWVRSGGRCARCNKYLLEDELTESPVNLGERAHIVGWTDTPGSPRGQAELPLSQRNNAANLMLLCMSCHKVIDDKSTRAEYTVERLTDMKREHEDRIFHLTGISPDMDTAVLRVFGSIRGSMPELARDVARQTVVRGGGRYAKFPLSVDKQSIELDLSQITEPEQMPDGAYWKHGKRKIDETLTRITEAVQQKHVRHLSIFALARIPLLVYLGYQLDDKIPTDIYQKHRGKDEGWGWPEDDEQTVSFEAPRIREGETSGDVVLILSLSGTIGLTELPDEVQNMTAYEIRPRGMAPNPNLFRSRSTLDAFARTYHDVLARLETASQKPKNIYLFPAVPITAAIACGRGLMRHVHPTLVIYDRIGERFERTITINEQ